MALLETGIRHDHQGTGGPPGAVEDGSGWRDDDHRRARLQVMSVLYYYEGANLWEISTQTRLQPEYLTRIVDDLRAEDLVQEGERAGRMRRFSRALTELLLFHRIGPGGSSELPECPGFYLTKSGREHPPLLRAFEERDDSLRKAREALHFRPWYLLDPRRWEFSTESQPYVTFN